MCFYYYITLREDMVGGCLHCLPINNTKDDENSINNRTMAKRKRRLERMEENWDRISEVWKHFSGKILKLNVGPLDYLPQVPIESIKTYSLTSWFVRFK